MQHESDARGGRGFFRGRPSDSAIASCSGSGAGGVGGVGAPLGWCLLAAALFGVSPPVAKALLRQVDPFVLAGLLYLGAALAVAPLSASGGGSIRRRRSARQFGYLVGAVVAGGVAGPIFLL